MTETETENKYIPSQYTHLANIYNQKEFTEVQKLLRTLSCTCIYNAKYPILKLLKAICRKMLINQFESVFFAFVVQTNRWNIQDDVIQKNCHQVRDIVCYATDNREYKSLTLYLLLCSYTVKYYLNEDVEIYTQEMNKLCPDFKTIFEAWAKQYAQTTLKINPKNLNKVYKQVYLSVEDTNTQYDYNSLVDNLLQISPSYNPQKDKDKAQSQQNKLKQKQIKEEYYNPASASTNFPLNSSSLVNLRILSSSGYLQNIVPFGNSGISSGFQVGIGMINASYFGLNQSINEFDPIKDVTVGFKAAYSDCQQRMEDPIHDQEGAYRKLGQSQISELLFIKKMSTFSNI